MEITHRVYNSHDDIVGFIIDGQFINNNTARKYISNLDISRISQRISLKQYNNQRYLKICEENPIERDIQADFENWRIHESDKVLQIRGTSYAGKTTELLKFAYKQYDQVIYIDITDRDNRFIKSLVNGNITIKKLKEYTASKNMSDYIDDKSTILVIDIKIRQNINIAKIRNLLSCDIAIISNEHFDNCSEIKDVVMNTVQTEEFCRMFRGRHNSESDLLKVYQKIGGYPWIIMKYLKTGNVENCLVELRDLVNSIKDLVVSQSDNVKLHYIVEDAFRYILKIIENDEYLKIFDIDTDYREVISILEYYNILDLRCSNVGEYKAYFTDCGVLNYILRDNNYSKADTYRIVQKAFKQI